MRSQKHAVALARPAVEPPPPPLLLSDEIARRVEASCPGDTFMPPALTHDPAEVIQRWVAEAELTGERDPYAGKRRYPRFTWSVIVLIRVRSGALAGKIIRARTRNVSAGGMGIQVRSQVEAGVDVEISVEGRPHSVKAAVVHCTRAVTGNLLGVSFEP